MNRARCHPEQSEGSLTGWAVTQITVGDQRDFEGSLAYARDDKPHDEASTIQESRLNESR